MIDKAAQGALHDFDNDQMGNGRIRTAVHKSRAATVHYEMRGIEVRAHIAGVHGRDVGGVVN
jgi:hypothetical protein